MLRDDDDIGVKEESEERVLVFHYWWCNMREMKVRERKRVLWLFSNWNVRNCNGLAWSFF
jgi:hypothetical protein